MIFGGKSNRRKILLSLGVGIVLASATPIMATAAPGDMEKVTNLVAGQDSVTETGILTEQEEEIDILSEDNIASGSYKGCNWVLNKNGKLTVRATRSDAELDDDWEDYAEQIKEVDIDVPYCSRLSGMFQDYSNLEKAVIKIKKCEGSASFMFAAGNYYNSKSSKLKYVDITGMNTSEVTSMSYMFWGCEKLTSLSFANMDTSKVESMAGMFGKCTNLATVNIGSFNTSNVADMSAMFYGCKALKVLDITGFDTYNVRDLSSMFYECEKLKSVSMAGWNLSNAGDISSMFNGCKALVQLNLNGWKTYRLKDMSSMFRDCENLKNLNLSGLNVASVVEMDYMFYGCKNLKTLNLNGFNTSKVETAERMFYNCSSLTQLNLKSFNTESLLRMEYMFYGCGEIASLDLSSFSLPKVSPSYGNTSIYGVFDNCFKLDQIKAPKNLKYAIYFQVTSGTWYRDDKKVPVYQLPMKMKKSVTLHRQETDNNLFDVRKTAWQYDPVSYVCGRNIMSGKEKTEDGLIVFDPDKSMTRAEFVQTLYNYVKPAKVKYDKNKFKDVANGKWYTDAIMWAADRKLVSGIGNKLFGVDNKVTRQDMVTILYKLAKIEGDQYLSVDKKYTLKSFTDYTKVEEYAKTPMTWAAYNKIISGKPSGKKYKLDPKGNATRAECAAIFKNYLEFKRTK